MVPNHVRIKKRTGFGPHPSRRQAADLLRSEAAAETLKPKSSMAQSGSEILHFRKSGQVSVRTLFATDLDYFSGPWGAFPAHRPDQNRDFRLRKKRTGFGPHHVLRHARFPNVFDGMSGDLKL